MQDKDSTRSSINKRMNVVHRCIRTPNIVLRALRDSITEIFCTSSMLASRRGILPNGPFAIMFRNSTSEHKFSKLDTGMVRLFPTRPTATERPRRQIRKDSPLFF